MRVFITRYRLTNRYMVIVNQNKSEKRPFHMALIDLPRHRVFVICAGPVALEFVKRY